MIVLRFFWMLLGLVSVGLPLSVSAHWWEFWQKPPMYQHGTEDPAINVQKIQQQASELSPEALDLGLAAYQQARKKGLDQKKILTIVDYSLPSTKKRLWVIDLKNNKVLYNTWVAHGEQSGDNYATRFSNKNNSRQTSLGAYVTGEPFVGNLGYSMRLYGVTPGFDTNAYDRNIVVHGAWYVGESTIKQYGHLGYTWGCFGINPEVLHPIIQKIQHGTLLLAYYPDQKLLHTAMLVTTPKDVG